MGRKGAANQLAVRIARYHERVAYVSHEIAPFRRATARASDCCAVITRAWGKGQRDGPHGWRAAAVWLAPPQARAGGHAFGDMVDTPAQGERGIKRGE